MKMTCVQCGCNVTTIFAVVVNDHCPETGDVLKREVLHVCSSCLCDIENHSDHDPSWDVVDVVDLQVLVEVGTDIAAHGLHEDQQEFGLLLEKYEVDKDTLVHFRDRQSDQQYSVRLEAVPYMGNRSAADEVVGIGGFEEYNNC
jgi:hypothetical protein